MPGQVQTSEVFDLHNDQVVEDPIVLLPPRRFRSDNAKIARRFFATFGPKLGDVTANEPNNGLSVDPGVRAWLELNGQNPVGLTRRTERTAVTEPWDADYMLNPEVV